MTTTAPPASHAVTTTDLVKVHGGGDTAVRVVDELTAPGVQAVLDRLTRLGA
jgi:hypothetical protein